MPTCSDLTIFFSQSRKFWLNLLYCCASICCKTFFIFREYNRLIFSDGIPCEIHMFSQEVEIFQATNELSWLFRNNSLHVGPCDRRVTGKANIVYQDKSKGINFTIRIAPLYRIFYYDTCFKIDIVGLYFW